jgi:hypothetical protein
MAKLTEKDKIEAEKAFVESFDELTLTLVAKKHGVDRSVISRLALDRNWRQKRAQYWKQQHEYKKENLDNVEQFLALRNSAILDNIKASDKLKGYLIEEIEGVEKPSQNKMEYLVKLLQSIINCENMIYASVENLKELASAEGKDDQVVEIIMGNYGKSRPEEETG